MVDLAGSKVTCAAWGPLNRLIYAGHENGDVATWDWQVRGGCAVHERRFPSVTDRHAPWTGHLGVRSRRRASA